MSTYLQPVNPGRDTNIGLVVGRSGSVRPETFIFTFLLFPNRQRCPWMRPSHLGLPGCHIPETGHDHLGRDPSPHPIHVYRLIHRLRPGTWSAAMVQSRRRFGPHRSKAFFFFHLTYLRKRKQCLIQSCSTWALLCRYILRSSQFSTRGSKHNPGVA